MKTNAELALDAVAGVMNQPIAKRAHEAIMDAYAPVFEENAKLKERIAVLEEALKPFAEMRHDDLVTAVFTVPDPLCCAPPEEGVEQELVIELRTGI